MGTAGSSAPGRDAGSGGTRACAVPSPLHSTLAELVGILALHSWLPLAQLIHWPWNLSGVGVIAFAFWLAARAEREFRDHATPVPTGRPVRTLVTTGPFRYSRNPMYAGLILASAGSAIGLGTARVRAPVAWLVWRLDRCARAEKVSIAAQLGAAYEAYRAEARRWV